MTKSTAPRISVVHSVLIVVAVCAVLTAGFALIATVNGIPENQPYPPEAASAHFL